MSRLAEKNMIFYIEHDMILFCCIMRFYAFLLEFKFICVSIVKWTFKMLFRRLTESPFTHWGLSRQPHRWRWQDWSRRDRLSLWGRCQENVSVFMKERHANWKSQKVQIDSMNFFSHHQKKAWTPRPPAGLKLHTPDENRCCAGEQSPLSVNRCQHCKETIVELHQGLQQTSSCVCDP